ncbi:hypothetical protein F4802DRAFT_614424 [Xylaria palmicola]|nr:hypothetical protein F4802DRAFT_614424 [Xylaria palmicola]
MVGFVGRFRKSKLPIALGSPEKDGVIHQQTEHGPQPITAPVLRNFSYPTYIINSSQPPPKSLSPSPWDQMAEICNFSSHKISQTRRDRTAGLEDPFFYTTDRTPYKQRTDLDETLNTSHTGQLSTELGFLAIERGVEKRRRRSTLLGPPSPQRGGCRDMGTRVSKNHSISDQLLLQKSHITARLKRSSVGRHKTSLSFDASRFLARRSGSLRRPVSSSGVPLIDTRLTHPTITAAKTSALPLVFSGNKITHFSYTMSDSPAVGMMDPNSGDVSGDQKCASLSRKHRGKEGKGRWFSQFKEWVSVSEPSTQALKSYKEETYKKAGIALDDPLANAKLHLPVASMSSDAIQPGGRGPEPEEIALQRAIQRKKARELLSVVGTSQESYSTTSHHSSSSNVTASALKGGN